MLGRLRAWLIAWLSDCMLLELHVLVVTHDRSESVIRCVVLGWRALAASESPSGKHGRRVDWHGSSASKRQLAAFGSLESSGQDASFAYSNKTCRMDGAEL